MTHQSSDSIGGTVDDDEVARFSALASEWWDPNGKMAVLHKFNPVRLAYIRDHACLHFGRDPRNLHSLNGLRLLDMGCGVGLLCEPMARLGADVVGVDPSHANIAMARSHATAQGLHIDYRCSNAETLAADGESFDIVLNMEVIEHVTDIPSFLRSCTSMVNPGGLMTTATINRTMKAFVLAIIGAEYILGWLPRGTHDWTRFVTPQELRDHLRNNDMTIGDSTGVVYNPFSDEWRLSEDDGVNYMLTATRDQKQT